jgi:hypothetical protein
MKKTIGWILIVLGGIGLIYGAYGIYLQTECLIASGTLSKGIPGATSLSGSPNSGSYI